MKAPHLIALMIFSVGVVFAPRPEASGLPRETSPPPQEVPAVSACADCHEDQVEAFRLNPHWDAGQPGHGDVGSCGSCHGDAETHIDEGGGEGTIFSFGDGELASVKTATCQSCHATSHPEFTSTAHSAAGLSCTDCHEMHRSPADSLRLLRSSDATIAGTAFGSLDEVSASCADCHGEVVAEFDFNESHSLQQGVLSCGDCHDPHEPPPIRALGGFKGEACADCHTDKTGPFVFEHGAQRVEGCVACHTPHGSPNRHMLTFQRVAETCYSCHAAVPGFHSRFTLDTVCTNCHSTIHGSNFDPDFLK